MKYNKINWNDRGLQFEIGGSKGCLCFGLASLNELEAYFRDAENSIQGLRQVQSGFCALRKSKQLKEG